MNANLPRRPKLYLPLALLAANPATRPATPLSAARPAPHELRRLVAAMVD